MWGSEKCSTSLFSWIKKEVKKKKKWNTEDGITGKMCKCVILGLQLNLSCSWSPNISTQERCTSVLGLKQFLLYCIFNLNHLINCSLFLCFHFKPIVNIYLLLLLMLFMNWTCRYLLLNLRTGLQTIVYPRCRSWRCWEQKQFWQWSVRWDCSRWVALQNTKPLESFSLMILVFLDPGSALWDHLNPQCLIITVHSDSSSNDPLIISM